MRLLEDIRAYRGCPDGSDVIPVVAVPDSAKRRNWPANGLATKEFAMPAAQETKQVFGVTFEQGRNNFKIDRALLSNVVTANQNIPRPLSAAASAHSRWLRRIHRPPPAAGAIPIAASR